VNRPARGLRSLLPGVAGIVISVALLAWAARGVDLASIGANIRRAHALPLIAAIVVATLPYPLRAIRWRLLLREEDGAPLPFVSLWHAVAIGFMSNNLLPFRAGELIRPFAITRLTGTRFTTALSSIAVERIFDGLTVVALLVVALVASGLPPDTSVGGIPVSRVTNGAAAISIAALLGAVFVVAFPRAAERMVRLLLGRGALATRLIGLIEGIRHGLAVLRSPSRLAGVVAWSLVLWLVNALAFFICFAAFDIHVPYTGALLLQGLLVLGIAIPSTPGFVGPFEAAITAALGLYGVPKDLAFSYAVTFHVTTFLPIVLLGAWSLLRTPLQLSDLRRSTA
jgi:uncharacterized protein (TIRG00374 family)